VARTPGSATQNEAKRRKVIHLVFEKSLTQASAAREAKVHLRTAQKWIALWRERGEDGIRSRKASGRPARLGQRQKKKLETILLKGAAAWGFSGELWTGRRIVEVIRSEFGATYNEKYIPRLLRALGWTVQRPQRQAVEKDRKKIDGWIRREWVRIKKKRGRNGPRSSS
jgi:transposase